MINRAFEPIYGMDDMSSFVGEEFDYVNTVQWYEYWANGFDDIFTEVDEDDYDYDDDDEDYFDTHEFPEFIV